MIRSGILRTFEPDPSNVISGPDCSLTHTHMQVNTYTYGSLWHFCLLNAVGLCGQRSHDHRNSAPHTIPSSCTPVFIPMATAKLGHPGYDSRCLGNVCVCERENDEPLLWKRGLETPRPSFLNFSVVGSEVSSYLEVSNVAFIRFFFYYY